MGVAENGDNLNKYGNHLTRIPGKSITHSERSCSPVRARSSIDSEPSRPG